nr:constitutive coactivator of peroxisome proliferator-activated receptor gamma-like [Rhipicephalus microplus]
MRPFEEIMNCQLLLCFSLNIPAHICFRSVRQRIYWILFRGDNSVIIREHVTYPGYIGIVDEAVPTASMHIQGGVPQLSHLWSPDPSLHLVRWRLFCGCLEMEDQIQEISVLPPTYVVFCCVLHHLFRARIIEEPELCALILQCILPSGTKLELLKRRIPNSEINADLVSVSTCVMIGIQCVTMALCVCGKPSPVSSAAPWLCFDGKLFHLIHRDLRELQTSVPSLLHHDGDRLHLYSQLWNIVTSR